MTITEVKKGLYRGPRLDIETIVMSGFKTILNLEDDKKAVDAESVLCRTIGIKFIHLPMSEILPPHSEQLMIISNIMQCETLYPMYVHCKHGQDRTGYAFATYRIFVDGWSFDQAYKEAKRMGHKWLFAPYLLFWPSALREIEVIARTSDEYSAKNNEGKQDE